ncbi:MAG: hypothetical protein WHU94_15155 [Thermogemmata sp.]|uniref:Glycosyltransferase RgtA/B/C/D-like domain-containing protein n=1 Tax=Thermogemmata fonticola TaxID=2755323 RepID=A0A7V9AAI1_9BACT|nr:hypothetical protein [Thermogemmata fonticola]MBA2225038.1 hypothetical protein [Thermogemmata fonticola]
MREAWRLRIGPLRAWRFPVCLPPWGVRTGLIVGLIAWGGFFTLYGIDTGPLYRTEALRAVVARCCWQEGCWLYPVLYGEPFLTKPPGHYLAIVLCSLPWGEVTEVSARLPSVVAAWSVLAACFLLWHREGFTAWGVGGVLALPLSLLWLDKVPSAEIDMTLTAWVTLALAAWYRAQPRTSESQAAAPNSKEPVASTIGKTASRPAWHRGYLALSAFCLAAGTLTKWTAPAFFLLTITSFAWGSGQWRLWRCWAPWFALVLAAGLCLLWAGAVMQAVGPETFLQTLRQEAAYRLLPQGSRSGRSLLEGLAFPLRVGAALLPLSLPALLMLSPRYHRRLPPSARRLALFLHCWVWPNLLFWTLVPNHNVRYVLPILPAMAGLGVLGGYLLLRDVVRRQAAQLRQCAKVSGMSGRCVPWGWRANTQWLHRGWLALLLGGVLAKVVFVEIVLPQRAARRNPVPIAAELQTIVPEHETLYIDKLKDDGVLFYYARPVRRWRGNFPLAEGAYVALIAAEWEQWQQRGQGRLLARLHDQQGDPLILVQYQPRLETLRGAETSQRGDHTP